MVKHEYFKPAEQVTRTHLSPSQFHSLAVLYQRNSLPMSELAGLLKMSKQQLTPVVAKLTEYQLVERTFDENDRRIVRIQITDKGRTTYQSVFVEIRRKFTDKLSRLPETSLDELELLLDRMSRILLLPDINRKERDNG
jgi:DNA-binding MarR family transcriptional regulator